MHTYFIFVDMDYTRMCVPVGTATDNKKIVLIIKGCARHESVYMKMTKTKFVPKRMYLDYAEVKFNKDGSVFVMGTDSWGNPTGKNVFLLCESDWYEWHSCNINTVFTYPQKAIQVN